MGIYFIASLKDEASKNMGEILKSSINFDEIVAENKEYIIKRNSKLDYYYVEIFNKELIYTQFLNDILYDVDFIIFLSKHESKKSIRSLSVHVSGIWNKDTSYGGLEETLSIAYPKLQTELLKEIYRNNKFEDFLVTLEVTHHGPSLDFPLVFYEVGSTLSEWRNEKIAEFMIDVLLNTLRNKKWEKKYEEVWFGVGNPHYAPYFNRKILEDEEDKIAIGHIMPNYVINRNLNLKKMLEEGVRRNKNKVNKIVIVRKSIPSEFRSIIIETCKRLSNFYKLEVYVSK